MLESCEICLYFNGYMCRCYPPQVTRNAGNSISTNFPEVHPRYWCGEYKPTDTKTESSEEL